MDNEADWHFGQIMGNPRKKYNKATQYNKNLWNVNCNPI
jgi:hypothetical protein